MRTHRLTKKGAKRDERRLIPSGIGHCVLSSPLSLLSRLRSTMKKKKKKKKEGEEEEEELVQLGMPA
ncbi:MAG: hypothetical protein WC763_05350 [Candidatus Paceibacterota bacterium]|jgi:hypothetical protein